MVKNSKLFDALAASLRILYVSFQKDSSDFSYSIENYRQSAEELRTILDENCICSEENEAKKHFIDALNNFNSLMDEVQEAVENKESTCLMFGYCCRDLLKKLERYANIYYKYHQ